MTRKEITESTEKSLRNLIYDCMDQKIEISEAIIKGYEIGISHAAKLIDLRKEENEK